MQLHTRRFNWLSHGRELHKPSGHMEIVLADDATRYVKETPETVSFESPNRLARKSLKERSSCNSSCSGTSIDLISAPSTMPYAYVSVPYALR